MLFMCTVMAGLGVLVILVGFLSTGCDPGEGVTWINETGQPVDVYLGYDENDFEISLAANSSRKEVTTLVDLWEDVVVVRDDAGNILFSKAITWDELEAQDFTFVIREEDIAAE